jgi:hypothetical protein
LRSSSRQRSECVTFGDPRLDDSVLLLMLLVERELVDPVRSERANCSAASVSWWSCDTSEVNPSEWAPKAPSALATSGKDESGVVKLE